MSTRHLASVVSAAAGLLLLVPVADAAAAITIPAGYGAALSGAIDGGCNVSEYGYTLTEKSTIVHVDTHGPSVSCQTLPLAGAVIPAAASPQSLLVYLQDDSCGAAMYWSDGSGTANHAFVAGTDSYTVYLADAGGSCVYRTAPLTPTPSAYIFKVDVVLTPPPADSDHDGIPDGGDRCPNVPRGAFDADSDGCPGPFRRIHAALRGNWSVTNRGLTIGSMAVGAVPVSATIKVSCTPCHVRQTLTAKRGTVSLRKLRGAHLKRGQGFTVIVTKPGFIGEQLTRTVRRYGHRTADFRRVALHPFVRRDRCIPVGSLTPAKACSATPPTGP